MSNAISVTGLNVDAKIDLGDILTIFTSKAELSYQQNIANLKEECDALKSQLNQLNSKAAASIKEAAATLRKADFDATVALFSALEPNVKVEIHSFVFNEDNKESLRTVLNVLGLKEMGSKYSIKIGEKSHEIPTEYAVLQSDSRLLQGELNKKTDELVFWKRKLSEIPQLERKYKAKLVESKLKSIEGGQAILDTLMVDLEVDILKLTSK
jgi:hypothetical protein